MTLDRLVPHLTVKIFLDSFNEMPREFWDSGTYEADFARFVAENTNLGLIIGSRTSDGLSKLDFPFYCLDEIDEEFVRAELERLRIDVSGRFRLELLRMLQKPFYFQLFASGAVSLARDAQPKDFYQAFFAKLNSSFEDRFGTAFDLEHALSLAAFEAIDQGEEAQPLSNMLQILQDQLKETGVIEITASEIANWLVSRFVLIPFRGARVAFFHQSATEYLAASELARRYHQDPLTLKERLSLTRWDQALYLTLSLLPQHESAKFLQAIVDADFALALRATKYLELNRDAIVATLLSEIPDRLGHLGPHESQIESAVQFGIEVSGVHEPQLRALMKCGNTIGAAAVIRLVELKGISGKNELLNEFVDARDDYNYSCNGIAWALRPFATPDDAYKIAALADSVDSEVPPGSDEDLAHGLTSGAAKFLSGLDIAVIRDAFLPNAESKRLSEVRSRILCNILQDHHSTEALDLAAELLRLGVKKAATAISFIANLAKPEGNLSWKRFNGEHVECLISPLGEDDEHSWSLRALRFLCERRPDLAQLVRTRAAGASLILRVALLYCAASGDSASVFETLAKLLTMNPEGRKAEPVHLLKQIDLDWAGHEELLIQLLRLRDTKLASALLNMVYGKHDVQLREVEVGPIRWWLDWMIEERRGDGFWFVYQMAWLFGGILTESARKALVAEFNRGDSRYRSVLADFILPRFPDLTTDVFNDNAISFLLADLNRKGSAVGFDEHLLGRTATERFVTERLLPLLPNAKPPLLPNLRRILRQAGSRHGRRYIGV